MYIFFEAGKAISSLILNTSNKNDVVNIMGQPQIKSEINQNAWIYLERTISKGKFHKLGKNILKDNNGLVLYFDKYGILENKDFLNKDDINKKSENVIIKFDKII